MRERSRSFPCGRRRSRTTSGISPTSTGSAASSSRPRRPLPAQALVRGITSEANLEDFDDDPLPVMFPLIDLVFIVAILLSLAALIFSYDAVSGEKEDGTLKLMLANGLPRHRILLGKVIGGTATLLIPFFVSLILGLIVVIVHPRVAWTGADWGALGLVLLGSAAYVVFFHILGVLISSRHASSSASIVTSLSVWVLLVLVVPNLSPFLASRLSPAPSRIKTSREISRLTDVERDELGRQAPAGTAGRPGEGISCPGPAPAHGGGVEGAGGEGPRLPFGDGGEAARSLGGVGRGEPDPGSEGRSPRNGAGAERGGPDPARPVPVDGFAPLGLHVLGHRPDLDRTPEPGIVRPAGRGLVLRSMEIIRGRRSKRSRRRTRRRTGGTRPWT